MRYFLQYLLLAAGLSLIGCATTPENGAISHTTSEPLIDYALSLQGAPYRYGKASPQEGFDCSGFVQYVYKHQGILLPRTVKAMAKSLPAITKDEVNSGDLLFFNTDGRSLSHVGIYISGDDFIHAPSAKTGRVLVSSLKNDYWEKHFVAARRPRR
jgi:cell wall-associated NlpC family hydrolase